jgi:hypothetical protein
VPKEEEEGCKTLGAENGFADGDREARLYPIIKSSRPFNSSLYSWANVSGTHAQISWAKNRVKAQHKGLK